MTARRLLAAAVLAVAAALSWPTSAGAADVATGWWHVLRQQTPVGALPAAPVSDAAALPVQNGPAGVLAYSAIKYDIGTASAVTMTLAFSSQSASTPAVDACVVTANWEPGADQTWDQRPAYECASHVVGQANGTQMVWQVTGLVRSGILDIALVPDAADPTPYSVSFTKPSASSFTVTPASGEPALPPAAPNPPAAATSGGGSTAPGVVPQTGTAGVEGAAPAAAPVVAPQAPVAALPSAPLASDEPTPHFASRSVAALVLAGAAVALLLRGVGLGPARRRTGRSLLVR